MQNYANKLGKLLANCSQTLITGEFTSVHRLGGHGSCQNFSQLPRMLSGLSIFLSHSKGLDEVLQSVQIEKYKQKKYVFNWDVVHLEFMQNLVKCKDRVINIASRAVINGF